jgi:hypothetical protein
MGVDVQPKHPGSNPHGCKFGFLLFILKKLVVGVSPTAFLSKNISQEGYERKKMLNGLLQVKKASF